MDRVFPVSRCGSEGLTYNALYHCICRNGDGATFVVGYRESLKPCHREGSFLLNSVGKLPFTTYSVCTSEARLTQNRDKGGIHCVLALGLGCDTGGEERGSVPPRRGSTEPSSGNKMSLCR